jgi:hypothetical protein
MRKPQGTSVKITDVTAEIQTEHLMNTRQERYC